MTILLLDIGNTRLKWAMQDSHGFHFLGQAHYADETLRNVVKDTYDTIWISNVVGDTVINVIDAACSPSQTRRVAQVDERSRQGVTNGYTDVTQLGVDRWLAMQAAWEGCRRACCVVDCGTAITLDVINDQGEHEGGLIIPGLRMMRQSLSAGTRALPDVTDADVPTDSPYARNTIDGITQGTLQAVITFIEKNAQGLIFLTGGDAADIAPYLPAKPELDPYLVLKGLSFMVDS